MRPGAAGDGRCLTLCRYIEAGMFGAAADVIANHPLGQKPPLYLSNLSARIRNLANVSSAHCASVQRFSFKMSSDEQAGQSTLVVLA